jgi:cytochrome P450
MPWRDDEFVQGVIELNAQIMAWIGLGPNRAETTPIALAASSELTDTMLPYVRERRSNSGDDLISEVWRIGPTVLSDFVEADAMGICRDLLMGGTDTTTHALANALYLLLANTKISEAMLVDRPARVPLFVEEALRLYGTVQYRLRFANQDCDVGGIQVKKNDLLITINAAANRDPTKYSCPADVNLNRPRPREHLAFNTGPRNCVGAALARTEMIEAISALLNQTSYLRLNSQLPAPHFHGHFTRSFGPLHVSFDPAPSFFALR